MHARLLAAQDVGDYEHSLKAATEASYPCVHFFGELQSPSDWSTPPPAQHSCNRPIRA